MHRRPPKTYEPKTPQICIKTRHPKNINLRAQRFFLQPYKDLRAQDTKSYTILSSQFFHAAETSKTISTQGTKQIMNHPQNSYPYSLLSVNQTKYNICLSPSLSIFMDLLKSQQFARTFLRCIVAPLTFVKKRPTSLCKVVILTFIYVYVLYI